MHRPTALVAALTAGLLLVALGATVARGAPPNELTNGNVTPRSGTTSTMFTFSVHYSGNTPVTVTAAAGSATKVLSLSSGNAGNGTYTGSRQLPAGTWPVTFTAVAAQNDPVLSAGQVTVAPPPTPTPAPSPPPTPAPTPAPTVRPTATPAPTPAASAPGSASGSASASATASAEPTIEASGGLSSDDASASPTPIGAPGASAAGSTDGTGGEPGQGGLGPFLLILAGGLLVAIGGTALLLGFARRNQEQPPPAAGPARPMPGLSPRPPRRPSPWEISSTLEDEPIGTVGTETQPLRSAGPPPAPSSPRGADPSEPAS